MKRSGFLLRCVFDIEVAGSLLSASHLCVSQFSAQLSSAVHGAAEGGPAVLGKAIFLAQGVASYSAPAIRARWALRKPVIQIPRAERAQWIHPK